MFSSVAFIKFNHIMISAEVEEKDSKVKKASELSIPIVETIFLDEIKTPTSDSVAALLTKMNIASWDCPNVNICFIYLSIISLIFI